jgi:two-component system chemotaxis sensor kinase CheA
MAETDMAQYLGVFLDEAGEQLGLLEQAMLQLEHAASARGRNSCSSTPELIQQIFRAAHTLKGSSRAMGFTGMGELTHALEDVFDGLRSGALEVTPAIADALFEALDTLKQQKEEIESTGHTLADTEKLVARIREIMTGRESKVESERTFDFRLSTFDSHSFGSELTPSVQEALDAARQAGCAIHALTIRLADDCLMKSVRALMALQSLETIGSILATFPKEEALENEEFDLSFSLLLASERPVEDIRQTALATTEVAQVVIEPFGDVPLPPGPLPPGEGDGEALPHAGKQLQPSAFSLQPSEQPAAPPAGGAAIPSKQTVRVDVARLDDMLNLVGELVINQTRIAQLVSEVEVHAAGDPLAELKHAVTHIGQITSEMQLAIMKARMLPVDHVFNRFPRMMRDMSRKLGKEMDFVISGRETELDRSVIEVMADPLIHLLRNSLDHGIETPAERQAAGKPARGTVWLRARHEGNHIIIEVEDDGRGIHPEKVREKAVRMGLLSPESASRLTEKEAVNLIFASGLSTAESVSDVSGRGVGMDIVKNNLTQFGALIEVESKCGAGTKCVITLPLTLAIIRALLVQVVSGVYAMPLNSVAETIMVPSAQIHLVNRREVIAHRSRTLPLLRLRRLFYGEQSAESHSDTHPGIGEAVYNVVVVGAGEHQLGLIVDSLLAEQEIVIKSLGRFIGDVRGVSGATILGDGRIAFIVDINGLPAIAREDRVAAHVV